MRREDVPTAPPRTLVDGDASAYGAGALLRASEAVTGASVGTRNATLNTEALGLYRLVAGGELAEHVVTAWLSSAALYVGLDGREIARTLASARRAGMAQPCRAPERVR